MRIGLRHYAHETVDWLKAGLAASDCTRTFLARGLCEREGWRNAKGELCLASARAALPKLSSAPIDRCRRQRSMMATHHPRGDAGCPGGRLRDWIRSPSHGILGGFTVGAAAWHHRARDRHIGWSQAARDANIGRVVNNDRFLLLPARAPLDWLLLTTGGGPDAANVLRVVTWYEKRWLIEEWFAALKVGTRIKDRRLNAGADGRPPRRDPCPRRAHGEAQPPQAARPGPDGRGVRGQHRTPRRLHPLDRATHSGNQETLGRIPDPVTLRRTSRGHARIRKHRVNSVTLKGAGPPGSGANTQGLSAWLWRPSAGGPVCRRSAVPGHARARQVTVRGDGTGIRPQFPLSIAAANWD